jgi:hypothetical protein
MTAFADRVGAINWLHPRTIGIGGIALGVVAFWLALPPVVSRTSAVPVLLGILAIATGIWVWAREERRIGGGAIAAGLLGIALGLLATRSSEGHLSTVVVWSALSSGARCLRPPSAMPRPSPTRRSAASSASAAA